MSLEEKKENLTTGGLFGKKWKRAKSGKSETWSWYLWEGEYVENTGGGLECVIIENKRSQI